MRTELARSSVVYANFSHCDKQIKWISDENVPSLTWKITLVACLNGIKVAGSQQYLVSLLPLADSRCRGKLSFAHSEGNSFYVPSQPALSRYWPPLNARQQRHSVLSSVNLLYIYLLCATPPTALCVFLCCATCAFQPFVYIVTDFCRLHVYRLSL
jgi:hypothetical protein